MPAAKSRRRKGTSIKKPRPRSGRPSGNSSAADVAAVSLDHIHVDSRFNLRVDESRIDFLAEDLREKGQLAPLLVREEANGQYTLIAGHRRLAALRLIGSTKARVTVLSGVSDESALSIAAAENIQRDDFSPLDKATLCLRLQKCGYKRTDIAKVVFPSLSPENSKRTVSNYLLVARTHRLVHAALSAGHIHFSHAIVLATCLKENSKKREIDFPLSDCVTQVIKEVKDNDLSVRECKSLINEFLSSHNLAPAKRKRRRSRPVQFYEGKNGNWRLQINYNVQKCDNNPSLLEDMHSSLSNAVKVIEAHLKRVSPD